MTEPDDRLKRARARWHHTGNRRPDFAREPGPGQESVWDYPRPPRVSFDSRHIVVTADATVIADTRRAVRVLETGGPPTFYLPPEDVRTDLLVLEPGVETFCEWKGGAEYFSLRSDSEVIEQAAWRYARPFDPYRQIAGYFSFYPRKLACYVDDEPVQAQPGPYYGGWVTHEIVGPFKGEPGTADW